MTIGEFTRAIQGLPDETEIVINNTNNDWGEIMTVSTIRSNDDGFATATVVVEFMDCL
ncbi:MAG: hypothetical protein RSF40_01310 [Oscillospiraceae bacterium]